MRGGVGRGEERSWEGGGEEFDRVRGGVGRVEGRSCKVAYHRQAFLQVTTINRYRN